MIDAPTPGLPDTPSSSDFSEEELFKASHYGPTIKRLTGALLAICILVLLHYTWLEGRLSFSVPWLLLPILLLVLALIQTGHEMAGTRILHWGFVLAALIGSYGVTGVSTPSLYLLPVLTMSAFFLLGRREAFAMFVFATFSVTWQVYFQMNGWVPPISVRSPEYYFLAIVAAMIAALLLGNAAAKNLISQYVHIRTMNQTLMENQARLVKEIAIRKEAESRLQQSEEQLRLVLEGAEQGFWDWNLVAGTVERDKRWAEMLGYTFEEIKNTTQQWTDFIHPEDRDRAWRSVNDVLNGRASSHKAEYRMLHKDGSIRWILDQANVMRRDEHGKPTRMSGTHTDITKGKLLEAENNESSNRIKTILDNLFTYVALLDVYGVVQEVNNAPLDRAGYRREDVLGQFFYDAPWWNYDEKVREQLINAIKDAMKGESSRYDVVVKMGDDFVPIDFQIVPVRDSSAKIVGLLPTAVDITDRKKAEEQTREAHAAAIRAGFLSDQALELAHAGHWNIDFSQSSEYYISCPRLVEIFGDPSREDFRYHIMNDWFVNLEAADKKLADATLANYLSAVEGSVPRYDMVHPYRRPCDGKIVWVHVLGHVARNEHGEATHVFGVVVDITQQKLFEQELEYQAHTDYLTGVSNRGHFVHEAELELARAIRYESAFSILMMDIDYFKHINDNFGHKAGDLVLKKLADLCRKTLREQDIMGRIGGEEFAILLPETSTTEAAEVAERLREAIASTKVPIKNGLPIVFTVSIGIASLTSPENNLDALLNLADKGLYEAKNSGRNKIGIASL